MQNFISNIWAALLTIGKPLDHPTLASPVITLHNDTELKDLESLQAQPNRIRQHLTILDAASFIEYVNRFKTEATVVLCNGPTGRTFQAKLDYHAPGQPSWDTHAVTYQCPNTVEWSNWRDGDRSKMNQSDFAEFIENNVKDIVQPEAHPSAPSAADMLEISRTLEAKKNISFRQGVRLDNGQVQLTYNEQIDGRAGETGQLSIPEVFYIGIKPFLGGEAFLIGARFRYRITEGKLVMWFELIRADKVLEEAYNAVRQQIAQGITPVPMYESKI